MKSIKEKAEEYSLVREYVDSCGNLIRENSRVKQEQFTLGANYVLDAIEECFNPKDDIVKQWAAIATLVEQLKK